MLIGCDPGRTGGIAVLDHLGRLVDGIRMPVLTHGRREIVDIKLVDQFVRENAGVLRGQQHPVVIEQVSSRPGQGVASTFNFGRHTGAVEGWAVSRGGPVNWVTPQKWKKYFSLSSDKAASLDRARLEFGASSLWTVKANDGIAEAALIALYWHRTQRN
jgi:hypothetical protein